MFFSADAILCSWQIGSITFIKLNRTLVASHGDDDEDHEEEVRAHVCVPRPFLHLCPTLPLAPPVPANVPIESNVPNQLPSIGYLSPELHLL